ncbi:hypothetical protein Sjap_003892 [Stephania japonica]|uniref:Uncharacterized protein n=1 Tax=Stephania japonica TaxID=461633 RepID=A0AAP0PU09_9MAGN
MAIVIKRVSQSWMSSFEGNVYKTMFSIHSKASVITSDLHKVRLMSSVAPTDPSLVSIYRVPNHIRQVETKAYDPKIVSIGPYHHGALQLQAMEELKRQYLDRLLNSIHEQEEGITMDIILDEMKKLEGKTRACYSEQFELSSDDFAKMMAIDGCFVLQLFQNSVRKPVEDDDIVFQTRWMLPVLRRDLVMLENQIPMFALHKLFDLTRTRGVPESTLPLTDLTLNFFNPLMPREQGTLNRTIASSKGLSIKHQHLLDLFRSSLLPLVPMARGKQPLVFRSIKELQEAGIKLQKRENCCSTLEISFVDGVLKVPPLQIDDYTGTLFRNVIAFEQCHSDHSYCKPDFTSYLFFIDGLVNTSEDIVLLHYAGVIQHSLGSDVELADLINKMCREVNRDSENESYLHLLASDVNEYCNKNWNKWRAELVHNYFGSPWALISLVSAVLFFVLAVAQTLMDYVAYRRNQ